MSHAQDALRHIADALELLDQLRMQARWEMFGLPFMALCNLASTRVSNNVDWIFFGRLATLRKVRRLGNPPQPQAAAKGVGEGLSFPWVDSNAHVLTLV